MPFDGSGNFTRNYNWTSDKLAGIKIESERMDGEFDNFAAGMNQVLLRNGVIPWTGDLKMGNNKIIGLGDGTAQSPAIQFMSDTTTGIFLQAAGNFSISASGVEQLRVNSGGIAVYGAITSDTLTTNGIQVNGAINVTGAQAWGAIPHQMAISPVTPYLTFFFNNAGSPDGAYFQYNETNKALSWVTGPNNNATFSNNGDFNVRADVHAGGGFIGGYNAAFYADANFTSIILNSGGCYLQYNKSNGEIVFVVNAAVQLTLNKGNNGGIQCGGLDTGAGNITCGGSITAPYVIATASLSTPYLRVNGNADVTGDLTATGNLHASGGIVYAGAQSQFRTDSASYTDVLWGGGNYLRYGWASHANDFVLGGGSALNIANNGCSFPGNEQGAWSSVKVGINLTGIGPAIMFASSQGGRVSLAQYGNSQAGLVVTRADGNAGIFTFDGQVAVGYAQGGWQVGSDLRLKWDVEPVTKGLDALTSLKPVSFQKAASIWEARDKKNGRWSAGLIAQDLLDSPLKGIVTDPLPNPYPDLEDQGTYAVDYNALSAYYIAAFKEVKHKLDTAEAKVKVLETALHELTRRVKALEK